MCVCALGVCVGGRGGVEPLDAKTVRKRREESIAHKTAERKKEIEALSHSLPHAHTHTHTHTHGHTPNARYL